MPVSMAIDGVRVGAVLAEFTLDFGKLGKFRGSDGDRA